VESESSPPALGEALPQPPLWLRSLCRLPQGVLYGLCGALVFIVRYALRYRVRVARENLRACFPDWSKAQLRQVLNEHYRRQGEVLAEALKLGTFSGADLASHMEFTGYEPIHEQLQAGRSLLLLTSHQCNWEWLVQANERELGVPIFAAYKPAHSAAAERAMLWLRGRFGVHMVPGKRLLRTVARQRHNVHVVGMMADQVPTSSGGRLWLSFLGRETAFFPGPAEIARVCKYTSYFVGMQRIGRGRYRTRVAPIATAGEAIDTATFTARYAAQIEIEVRAAPADWTWTHRRWKLIRGAGEALSGPITPAD
jgi:KDO2-lipid IV(A) lauroyltransferase